MKSAKKVEREVDIPKLRPATTPEARENQCIALAMDLVEERLRKGTATSQEVTHFLKLGSTNAKMESEKLRLENELLKAKTAAIESQKKIEEMYAEAIAAMQIYAGRSNEDEDEVFY